ncbi:MAG: 2-oxo acid dehydrogenase subunit E2, partial [Spirochaetales bacterium]|nr:2-oxo acid dehydrogenase subunit E2 [Spirochaetales bacterium]
YHHLSNFGSNSLFAIIGRKEKKPVYDDDGTVTMKEFLPVSFTIDERIADGVYFNNSIKVLKAYLLKPELLDLPAKEKIDIRAVEEELGLL